MGFVTFHTNGWQWIYWILAITNGVQFVLYFFFSPETLYIRKKAEAPTTTSSFRRKYLTFEVAGAKPLTARDFIAPITLFAYPSIVVPTIAYSVVFIFAGVFATVEVPQIFAPRFHFNPQEIGLQFIGIIIGSMLGEMLGGYGSDLWMRSKSAQLRRSPEHRLWVAHVGFATVICGLVVFTVQADVIRSYNLSPIVGLAIASFGNQIITTVLVTYAVDCHHEHSASIGVFVTFVRNMWSFTGMPSAILLCLLSLLRFLPFSPSTHPIPPTIITL